MFYATIEPPFTLKFREMSRKELRDYFEWFHCVRPHRLGELAKAVRHTPGFEGWRPDLTVTSLGPLGDWFSLQVEIRLRTPDEMQEGELHNICLVGVAQEELTNRTFSLAIDVGMYLSEVFLNNCQGLRWDQLFGNKKFVDYGQPVLVGFGVVPFNPVRMVVTYAYGVASKKEGGKGLRDIYDIWSRLIG